MGISINIAIQLARIAPLVADCDRGLMLGRQKLHMRPQWHRRLLRDLHKLGIPATEDDLFQPDGFCERYLATIGWPPMESLDFVADEGAAHVHDLAQPVPESLHGAFDLVYDGGTTEHVFDIAEALRNADRLLKPNGIFVSCCGADGWFGHGFFQIGPDIPWRYWGAHLGYEVLGVWCFPRARRADPVPIPDPTGQPRGAERRWDVPQFLFYAVRKTGAAPAGPVIQSHYVS